MNAITTQTAPAPAMTIAPSSPLSLLMDMQRFEHLQRVGKMLALSPLFPQHLRGGSIEQGIANGVLVLNMAHRLNEDPLTVAQNIYFVGGRPGWNTSYMIAKANQHGVFRDVIDWEVKGKDETLSVTGFAVLAGTGKRVQVTLDMETAKKENWTKNAKYQSIPEQMLRYRTAAFLIRLYCPEVMVGVPSAVELELEARDITPTEGPAVVEANEDPPIEAKAEPTKEDSAPSKTRADLQKDFRREQAQAGQKTAARSEPEQKPAEQGKSGNDKPEDEAAQNGAADPGAAQGRDSLFPDDSAQGGPTDEEAERFAGVADLILADMANGSTTDEINELYGPQIEIIRKRFPDLMAMFNQAHLARQSR